MAVSSFSFNVYFDCQFVYKALNDSMHSILIISRINRSHSVYEIYFTDRKRDGIPNVIIPCDNITLLRVIIDKSLTFKKHIGNLVRKAQYKLHALPGIRKFPTV